MRWKHQITLWGAASLLCLCAVAGCGSDSDLAAVTGRITLNGRPLEGAIVQFQPVGQAGSPSAGITDEDGRYELMFTFNRRGAMVGEHRVTIRTAAIYYEDEDCDCEKADPIPPEYNDNTELVRIVEPSGNSFDFDLTSPASKWRERRGL